MPSRLVGRLQVATLCGSSSSTATGSTSRTDTRISMLKNQVHACDNQIFIATNTVGLLSKTSEDFHRTASASPETFFSGKFEGDGSSHSPRRPAAGETITELNGLPALDIREHGKLEAGTGSGSVTSFQINIFDVWTPHRNMPATSLAQPSVHIGDVIRLFHAEHDAFLTAAGTGEQKKVYVHAHEGKSTARAAARNSNRLFVISNPDSRRCELGGTVSVAHTRTRARTHARTRTRTRTRARARALREAGLGWGLQDLAPG